MLLAHAKAWHIYDDMFRDKQKGKITIVVNSQWYEPASNCQEDLAAANRGLQWYLGWIAHPVFFGDYPEVMKESISAKSRDQGIPCRLVLLNTALQDLQMVLIITEIPTLGD